MILSFLGMVGGRCSCRVALSLAGRGFAGFVGYDQDFVKHRFNE